ncbi:MAG: hypothetical protein JOZ98_02590 [Solirubrobacterales bacterium]|nr:hypothetical protein [Solirubrobacterales bacterium]MBV9799075.1 hypothetical protein [Solirubrobacterales bacterium]
MFSVFIPVGATEREPERLADTLDSLRAHAPSGDVRLTLIDDSPRPRRLESLWPGVSVIRTALWDRRAPDPFSAMTAGTIEALKRAEGDFALKLDTDAVVIAPFADSINSILAEEPSIGIIGAYDVAADGGRRDWSMWPALIRRTGRPVRAVRGGGPLPRVMFPSQAERGAARRAVRAAEANPTYVLGAHCLGGAYAVSRSLFARRELLDWRPWVGTRLGEDVVLGILCAAAGLRMRGAAGAAEPFAVAWKGLPAEPSRLVARGHSIVHSVKDGTHGTECELREWFRLNAR